MSTAYTEPSRSLLPSWRPSGVLDELLAFLAASESLPPSERVAVFDNDGTLWAEKPAYFQLEFFLHELRKAAVTDPALAGRAEYGALLRQDHAALADLGLLRIALALAELCAGLTPEEFAARSARFLLEEQHPTLGRPFAQAIYQPMLELLDALRAYGFATFVVTGGGTEFVRAVSQQLYGVPPEGVVGTLIEYEYLRHAGAPALRRTGRISGDGNEGPAKVLSIQQHLGRRPVFAAGNSAGDLEMIEWALATPGPALGLLIVHDDAEREFAYESKAATAQASTQPIVDVGRRQGWTVVSMREHWSSVFPPRPGEPSGAGWPAPRT
nr:haloacid dehalogenase-like hydrolase [Propionibacterium sp.]